MSGADVATSGVEWVRLCAGLTPAGSAWMVRMLMPAIEARGLTKIYRTYKKKPGLAGAVQGLFRREYTETKAVDGITFSIEEGEFVGFLGPNGAGKTTALKMLSGLLNPTAGEARVLDFVPWERRDGMKRQISLLMGQKNALWWDLPARESLELNRAIYGIAPGPFREIVEELTTLFGVKDKLDVMVRELSLGERMQMELISALVHRPKVLFLDEPTIGLDVTSQVKVREFLRRYNAGNRIVTMLTSHYMEDIEALCRRVIVIDHGRLFFDGPLADIVERFSTHKIISLTFYDPPSGDYESAGEILERTDRGIKLRVPRARVTEVARDLLAASSIHDISVEDPPVEDVIRQLFAEQAGIAEAERH
jgi:ABC-2 type transport system ATP-binding protein